MYSSSKWGIWSTLLLLIPLMSFISYFSAKQHYTLPTPVGPVDSDDPRISEFNILATSKHLSQEIGYRTVGSREHAEGDAWLYEQVLQLQKTCQRLVEQSQSGRNLECEVWRQQGNGEHRFDMMGHRLYKKYVNLTNIIVRFSNGTPAGKKHAILVNSHLDSTPPSPGAADDALAVGVMLDCLRVLLHTPNWEPKNAIIFLFNNAEETLQDGSHLYSTQHPTAETVRAMINLEAAGSKGPEILFQATSEEMVEAYAKVPYPYGTILANDIFRSVFDETYVINTDFSTDFRQFEQYLNVSGLDMAVVGHSYFYHTQKDTVENIEPGVAQHMAENTLALLRHFVDSESALPQLSSVLPHMPQITYLTILGKWFFMYSFSFASLFYTTLWVISMTVSFFRHDTPSSLGEFVKTQGHGLKNVIFSTISPILGANFVALIMTKILDKSLSWFSGETLPIVLYGPPSIAALLISQLLLTSPYEENESSAVTTALLWNSTLTVVLQLAFNLGSSAVFMFPTVSILAGLTYQRVFGGNTKSISLGFYIIGSFLPLVIGTEIWCGTGDVFVPLTGRLGEDAPAEYIIASLVALVGSHTFPLLSAFAHRFGRQFIARCAILFSILSVATIFYMAQMEPFDDQHPKRIFIIHSENITTGAFHLNIAASDGSPNFGSLVSDLADEFGHETRGEEYGLSHVVMNDWNGDWDTLYPFSAFLTPFRMQLITSKRRTPEEHTFRVSALDDTVDLSAGTRSLTLQIEHPGIIWTVIAFDAHVLRWSLDDNPPEVFARHHVKEASFYGTDVWHLDLVIKIPQNAPNSKLKVNFIGTKESVQWPAKKGKTIAHEDDRRDLALLEEIHTWLKHKTSDSVDAMLFGTLGGVVYL